ELVIGVDMANGGPAVLSHTPALTATRSEAGQGRPGMLAPARLDQAMTSLGGTAVPRAVLHGQIVVLAPRHLHLLSPQQRKRPRHPHPRGARRDHVVDVAAFGGSERGEKAIFILLRAPGDLLWIVHVGAEDDLHRPLGAHYGDLCRGPCVVDVPAHVL